MSKLSIIIIILNLIAVSSLFANAESPYEEDPRFDFGGTSSNAVQATDLSVVGKALDSATESFLLNKEWCQSGDMKFQIKNKIKGNIYKIFYNDDDERTPHIEKAAITMTDNNEIVLFYFFKNPFTGTKSYRRSWLLRVNNNRLVEVKVQRGDEYEDNEYKGSETVYEYIEGKNHWGESFALCGTPYTTRDQWAENKHYGINDITSSGQSLDPKLESLLLNKKWCSGPVVFIIKDKIQGTNYSFYYGFPEAEQTIQAEVTKIKNNEFEITFAAIDGFAGEKKIQRERFKIVDNDKWINTLSAGIGEVKGENPRAKYWVSERLSSNQEPMFRLCQ